MRFENSADTDTNLYARLPIAPIPSFTEFNIPFILLQSFRAQEAVRFREDLDQCADRHLDCRGCQILATRLSIKQVKY